MIIQKEKNKFKVMKYKIKNCKIAFIMEKLILKKGKNY